MKKERITTDALRAMALGQTRTFELPDAAAIEAGKTLAYREARVSGCRFQAESDYAACRLTLKKLPR